MFTFYLFNSVVSFKGEKIKIKEKVKKISYVNKSGLSDDCDVLIKETDNATLLELDSDGTGHGLYIHKDGTLASGKHALKVYSGISQGNEPLVYIRLDNTGCTKEALRVETDATTENTKIQTWYVDGVEMGYIDIEGDMHVEGSFGSFLDIISSTATSIASSVTSTVTQAVNTAVSSVSSSASQTNSPTAEIISSNSQTTTPALVVTNDSTQSNTQIAAFTSGGEDVVTIDTLGAIASQFMHIATSVTDQNVLEVIGEGVLDAATNLVQVFSDAAQTTATSLVNFLMQSASSTVPVVLAENYGSGECISVVNYGTGSAVDINQVGITSSGKYGLHVRSTTQQSNSPLVYFDQGYGGGLGNEEVLQLRSTSSLSTDKLLTFYDVGGEIGYIDKQRGGSMHDLRYQLYDPSGIYHGIYVYQESSLAANMHALCVEGRFQTTTSSLVKFSLEDIGYPDPLCHVLELYGETKESVLYIHDAQHGGEGAADGMALRIQNDVGGGIYLYNAGTLPMGKHAVHIRSDYPQTASALVVFNSESYDDGTKATLRVTHAGEDNDGYAQEIDSMSGALYVTTRNMGAGVTPAVHIQSYGTSTGGQPLLKIHAQPLYTGKCLEIAQGKVSDNESGIHIDSIGGYKSGHNALRITGTQQSNEPLVLIKEVGTVGGGADDEALRVFRGYDTEHLKIQTWWARDQIGAENTEVAYIDTEGNFHCDGEVKCRLAPEGSVADKDTVYLNHNVNSNAGKYGLHIYTNVDQTNSPLAMFHHDAACEQGVEVVRVRQDDTTANAKVQSWYAGTTERGFIDIDGDMFIDGDFGCDSNQILGWIIHDDASDFAGTFNGTTDYYDKITPFVFKEDFEDGVDGNAVSGIWTADHDSDCNVYYEADPVLEGNLCARFYDNNGSGMAKIYHTLDISQSANTGTIEFKWRKDGNTKLAVRVYNGGTLAFAVDFSTLEKLRAYYNSTWNNIETGLSVDTTYTIKIDYNLSAGTYDLYRDDVLKGNDLPFEGSVSSLNKISLETGDSVTGTGYIDIINWLNTVSPAIYESQPVSVGQGVEWSRIYWTQNLDGATITVKTRTSEDGETGWDEWQTHTYDVEGSAITGDYQYIQYKIEITSGTGNTYVDDVKIKYYV